VEQGTHAGEHTGRPRESRSTATCRAPQAADAACTPAMRARALTMAAWSLHTASSSSPTRRPALFGTSPANTHGGSPCSLRCWRARSRHARSRHARSGAVTLAVVRRHNSGARLAGHPAAGSCDCQAGRPRLLRRSTANSASRLLRSIAVHTPY
jgi:hypothetical protein